MGAMIVVVMSSHPRPPTSLLIFTALYFLLACLAAFLSGNREFIFYIVVMVVLISAIFAVHRRSHLSTSLLWCFSVWGLLHMAGGLVQIPVSWPYEGPHNVLYSFWIIPEKLKYDQVVHAYGFGITTWLCWEALRNGVRLRDGYHLAPTVGVVVLCVAGGMGFGAFNEVVEFVATLTLQETNVGGYVNTGWDLVYNALGASAAGCLLYFRGRSAREGT